MAGQLRDTLQPAGFTCPATRRRRRSARSVPRSREARPGAADTAQQLLTAFETRAITSARPTPGSADLIITAHRTGRTVTIVSNNSGAAITAYLADHQLTGYIRAIVGP